jgi:transposase InsO family protein
LVTDHKPLTTLFNPDKPLPVLASGRIQRWAIFLMNYQFTIQFRPTTKHGNVDALSRLPLDNQEMISTNNVSILQLKQFEEIQVTVKQIAEGIRKNPKLAKVLYYVRTGWPRKVDAELMPYFSIKNELTIEENCLLRGMQVIVPPDLQKKVLKLMHEAHIGVVKMKALARSYVWWPGMDKALEEVTKQCEECQVNHREDSKTPLHPLEFTTKPWQRIHLDFSSPFQGQMWLIVIDSHSRWPEVIPMRTTTASQTIKELRFIFARFGLPEQILSDNGPQFTSDEFREFTIANGIQHIKIAPYHPRSNGMAERFVQTFKNAMKKMKKDGDINQQLANFLLVYRKTPQSTTTEAPAMLLMKRIPRSRLDLITPNLQRKVEKRQDKQKKHFDKGAKPKEFKIQETVWVRDYQGNTKWVPGTIEKKTGPLSYIVNLENGLTWRRHADQLRHREVNKPESETPELVSIPDQPNQPNQVEPSQTTTVEPTVNNRPHRNARPPDRLTYYQRGKSI